MSKVQAMVSGYEIFSRPVLQRLAAGGWDVNRLRTYDSLQEDDWKRIDDIVVQVVRQNMVVGNSLRNRGLVDTRFNLGHLLSQWYTITDIGDAIESMSGRTRGDLNRQGYNINAVPIPITHIDFEIDWRAAIARENGMGAGFDVSHVAAGTRKVVEKIENSMINGGSIVLNGNSMPGLITHTDRVTGSLTATWTNTFTRDVIRDIINMKAELTSLGFPEGGPYLVYIPTAYASVLDEDYSAAKGEKTFKQRILAIEGVDDIMVAHKLPTSTNHVVMVYAGRENLVIDQAADVQTVEWDVEGGFASEMKVMAAMVLRLMPDSASTLGVVDYTP